ncbi:MAG: molecular chaperone HtpG [Pelagibacterales bacterium]|nr:molecular chaperone HtpG [Pelagibacterales bacterium]|tara:strand:+ start:2652 stop:4535 length:1884 start_codon:yes stop_codon:yes gene_type:complete
MAKETFTFQAEVGKILDIVAHSLYSEKEVFLRELISNSSDACDKLRYATITDSKLAKDTADFKIEIDLNKKEKTITISDNGIGMTRDEMVESLGTIAKSGTQAFMESLEGKDDKDVQSSLIGQFGVGFYSAFMVADNITVISKKAGSSDAWSWKSDGKGSFEVDESQKGNQGTEVILSISDKDKEFLDPFRIESVVKKYSDHIAQPVILKPQKKGEEDKVLNNASALWTRDKKDISAEQYKEFYHHVGMAYDDPWLTLHNKAEGLISYTNLLFIPSTRPFDIFNPDRKSNLKLYVRRVFITDDCEGLIPPYLRFVKGVIDTDDIDLNVSREMLQNNPVVAKIKSAIIKRIISELKKKANKDPEDYAKFWEAFGAVLKEGIHEDFTNRDKILEVSRFKSSEVDKYTSLEEYITRMKKGQDKIYYISGEDVEKLSQSPHLEGFKAKGIEVLFMTDPVDEFWLPSVGKYSEKDFQSITKGGADLDKIKTGKKDTKEKDKKNNKSIDKLVASIKVALGDEVKEVKSSERLTDSAVCLVAGEGDMDMHLEKLLKQHQQIDKTSQKVLEINPSHPLINDLLKILDNEKEKNLFFDDASWLLLDQAKIMEGQPVSDPNKFARRMNALMQRGIKI